MFSIVIPLYNKEQYVERTIHSILSQIYRDYEIVIVDDGSTDNSLSIVRSFDDPRIRIVQQKNAGVSAARNRGIAEARYDLIAFLDADDEWLPSHLEEISQLSNDFPECDVFVTNYKIVDTQNQERIPVNIDVVLPNQKRGIIENYFYSATRTAPPISSITISVRKKALEDIGGFPVGITLGEDLLTWARLACKYKIAYSNTITAIYHFHTFSTLSTPGKKPDVSDNVGDGLNALMNHCRLDSLDLRSYIGLWHRMRLNEFMKRGERLESIQEMKKVLSYNWRDYKSYVLFTLAMLPSFIRNTVLQKRAAYQERKITPKNYASETMQKPLISIITVVYNGAKTLEETITSVINQTYENIEYIIIDGGSTDTTLDIIKKYEDKIHYWISEPDQGIYDAINKGIKIASGEIIHLLNADDYYIDSQVIDKIVKIKVQPILTTSINYIMENEVKVLSYTAPKQDTIPHPGLFINSEIYKQLQFDLHYKLASDIDLLLKLDSNHIQKADIISVNMRAGGAGSSAIALDEAIVIYWRHFKPSRFLYALTKKTYHTVKNLFKMTKI
ncbi:MAG: glycosyltransferase [Sulfuricurvum sp.]|nr:glycosyltransferase [Sulfuricurvum sp.]